MFLGCSDSRVSEGTIFHSLPGELFAERNIANQFRESDTNACVCTFQSSLCTAVLTGANRPEIVQLREENRRKEPVPTPELHEPGFRALVEENVKVNVERILKAARSVHESGKDVYVHGWVYDMENGKILDLDVSVKV
ncbi:hypothetical protein EYR40_007298 [Pleurotus pulmonarius]|nr:hypothetical protein EYR36_003419 [Pleurotus pulmonarius]KAF4600186.1 hypothetical protein EYR40_007298 [Pleurotus pulmonarius]